MKFDNKIAIGGLKAFWLIYLSLWLWSVLKAVIIILVLLAIGLAVKRVDAASPCPMPREWSELVTANKELACLAQNVYMEARGEPTDGKLAVAWVTIRRSQIGGGWPTTICGVVWQTNQFTWTAQGCRYPAVNTESWRDSYEIAGYAWAHRNESDLMDQGIPNAQYFLNPDKADIGPARWMLTNRRVEKRIGNHVFLSDPRIVGPPKEIAVPNPSLKGLRITRLAAEFLAATVQALYTRDSTPIKIALMPARYRDEALLAYVESKDSVVHTEVTEHVQN